MDSASTEHVFSIPYRYLWSTQFSGDLDMDHGRPSGLARFVGDQTNQILRVLSDQASPSLIGDPSFNIWPLVLYGPSGTGKTSLAMTLVSDLPSPPLKNNSAARKPIVLTSLDFDRRYRSAMETDSVPDFRRRLLARGGIVIDDLQNLSTKKTTQRELVHRIDQFILRNRPIIFTMNGDPQTNQPLIPQLASRLCGGLTLPVKAPGPHAREIIIRDLCAVNGLNLTEEVISLLVDRLKVTVPKIVHFMLHLKTSLAADSTDSSVIDSARIGRMLSLSDDQVYQFSKIITQHVAREFQLKPSELRGSSRKQSIVQARCVAIYLTRKLLRISFVKIGNLFGHRDHSTIMHAHRKIETILSRANTHPSEHANLVHQIQHLEQRLANLLAAQINLP